jgi:hypothetical protein
MYGQTYYCMRCGARAYAETCGECEREYRAELAEAYDAGEPRPMVVGRAFGGEIAILVHEEKESCGCRGSGWHSTDFDTLHECPHHKGAHPEFG